MNLQQIIEKHWYKKDPLLHRFCLNVFLFPLSGIFLIIVHLRYLMYKIGILKSFKLPVPVVVIGNITVGGSGKTPLCKYLAQELCQHNIKVGVILRGYKSLTAAATIVKKGDNPKVVGDEALIYASNAIPVAIGINRYQAGLKLLEKYPEIKIILSDDGMQHYQMKRDFEIAVIDGVRLLGNKCLLPNGPLRETVSRLTKVNALIVNGQNSFTDEWLFKNLAIKLTSKQLYCRQKLILKKIYNPDTGEEIAIEGLKNKSVVAMAGIGNPQRFFQFIEDNGIKLNHTLAFPDHYYYLASDIPTNYAIILTSDKDYTKLRQFKHKNIYVVDVESHLNNTKLIENISNLIPRK